MGVLASVFQVQYRDGPAEPRQWHVGVFWFLAFAWLVLLVLELKPARLLRLRNLHALARELAAAAAVNLPLQKVLCAFASDRGGRIAEAARRIAGKLDGGLRFSAAIKDERQLFPGAAPDLIWAGERAGDLPGALSWASMWAGDEIRSRSRALTILWYPALLTLSFAALADMLMSPQWLDRVWSLPFHSDSLSLLEKHLPSYGSALVWFRLESDLVFGWLPLAAAVIFILERLASSRGGTLLYAGSFRWFNPLLAGLERRASYERFCRAAGIALKMGVRVPAALRLAAQAGLNPLLGRACSAAATSVEGGTSMGDALRATGRFPDALMWKIANAEKSRDPGQALARLASEIADSRARAEHRLMVAFAILAVLVVGANVLAIEYICFTFTGIWLK